MLQWLRKAWADMKCSLTVLSSQFRKNLPAQLIPPTDWRAVEGREIASGGTWKRGAERREKNSAGVWGGGENGGGGTDRAGRGNDG
jgi:hypothetical protein